MDREEFRQLLKETDDKLSILGNVEILRQCKMNLGELYDLIKIFLTDREISKLLEYKHFQKWPSYKRKELILMISDSEILLKMLQDEEKMEGFKSWDLESFIEKLNDSDKEKLLDTPGWFESHGFLPYEVSKIIAEMEDSIKYNIVSNPDLICNMLQLDNIDISDIIVTLKKEEDKKIINIVNISDIKLYNNKVQVHQKNTEVYIQTIKNNFTIKFDNAIEAVKFVTKVTDVVTGTTMSDRGVKKLKILLIK